MFQPTTLDEIVGQPAAVRRMRKLTSGDAPACFLLEGTNGTGKTSSAHALANELGALDDWDGYFLSVESSSFKIVFCQRLFNETLKLRRRNWKVVVIEELEYIHPQVERFLKVRLERLPGRTCVIATTNDSSKFSPAFRERFNACLQFTSGPTFADACRERIAELWESVTEEDLPPGWMNWGQYSDRFSMRDAMRRLDEALMDVRELCPA